jgi:hypothetical protein
VAIEFAREAGTLDAYHIIELAVGAARHAWLRRGSSPRVRRLYSVYVNTPTDAYGPCRNSISAHRIRITKPEVNRAGAQGQSARGAGLDWPAPETWHQLQGARKRGGVGMGTVIRDGGATANISREGGAGASEVVVGGRRTDAIESDWELKEGRDPGERSASAPDGDGTCHRCTNFE